MNLKKLLRTEMLFPVLQVLGRVAGTILDSINYNGWGQLLARGVEINR